MISSLRGKVDRIRGNSVEIEVGGMGYSVWMGKKKFNEGDEVKIWTYMAVSENEISLYGFEMDEDLDLFKMLITVSGVGPKTAAGILAESSMATLDIIKAIGEADVDFFKKIKGVGLKTAQRIIVDLKSKIGGLGELNLKDDRPLLEDDVVLSLKQLGFDRKEVEKVIKLIPKDLVSTEDRLSWCLLNLGR